MTSYFSWGWWTTSIPTPVLDSKSLEIIPISSPIDRSRHLEEICHVAGNKQELLKHVRPEDMIHYVRPNLAELLHPLLDRAPKLQSLLERRVHDDLM